MSDYEIVQVLSQYGEYFQGYDLVSYLLRSLGLDTGKDPLYTS